MNLDVARKVLEQVIGETTGSRYILLIDTGSKKPILEIWSDQVGEREQLKEQILHILDYVVLQRQKTARNPFIREALRDFREMFFETERGYALFTSTPFPGIVIASGITRETGLGLWKAILSRAMERIKDAGD